VLDKTKKISQTIENLDGEVAFFPEPIRLRPSVTPDDITLALTLKVPRRNQHNVTFAYPNSPFDFASYSAQALVTVLTLNHDSVEAQEFDGYT